MATKFALRRVYNFGVKYFSDKYYKVTFSGLDKFISNEELNNTLAHLNELKIIRTNKSSNKNYAHLDVSSNLSVDIIKRKFESIKILGKNVKVRVKEQDNDYKETNKNIFDFSELNKENEEETHQLILKFVKMFISKNLTDNPYQVIAFSKKIEENKNIIKVEEYTRKLFDFNYQIQVLMNLDTRRVKEDPGTFLSLKGYSEFDQKSNPLFKEIFSAFERLFIELKYPSYDLQKRKGIYRQLQIKYTGSNENKFIITLMVSAEQLSDIDKRILIEAIKFEFNKFKDDFIIYLAINEKNQATINNSTLFYMVQGLNPYITLDKLHVFPMTCDTLPLYLSGMNLEEIFGCNNFEEVYEFDYSNNIIPISSILNIKFGRVSYYTEKLDFKMFDDNQREIVPLNTNNNFELITKNSAIKSITNTNSLFIINLKNISARKINWEFLESAKYQILISNSFVQILDFFKNYKKLPNIEKIVFVKDEKFEINDIIVFIKI